MFFKLSTEIGFGLFSLKLTSSDYKLWIYLATLDPFGDRLITIPSVSEICQKLNMSLATFFRSKAKLQKLELIKFKQKETQIQNLLGESVQKDAIKNEMEYIKNEILQKENGNVKTESETLKIETPTLKTETATLKIDKNPRVEVSQDKGFSFSQTIQTIQTLSDFSDCGIQEIAEAPEIKEREGEILEVKEQIQNNLGTEANEVINSEVVINESEVSQINSETSVHSLNPNNNNHFPPCRTANDQTKDCTATVNIYSNKETCPKSYQECPSEFLDWKAKDWANHFGYSETKAHQNLKLCLRKPEKIAEYWSDYQEAIANAKQQKEILVEWTTGEWITKAEYDRRLEERKNSHKSEEIPVNEKASILITNFLKAMRGENYAHS